MRSLQDLLDAAVGSGDAPGATALVARGDEVEIAAAGDLLPNSIIRLASTTKPIIADGGIRHHGDIAKSVRFGAAMVMIGSLFAGHEESPGQTVEVDGKLYKEYFGSASDFNKGEYKHVEGMRILEPIKGRLADTLREMREDLQSSISYGGGLALADLRRVNYVILGGENAGEHLFM